MNDQASKPKPTEEVRMGTIKAAIWRNETAAGVRHSITFRRLYTQMDGAKKRWKSSDSFGRDDLLVLAKVAHQAHTRILELEEHERQGFVEE